MESKFDVLGIVGKLVKYVVHLSKRKKFKKIISLPIWCAKKKQLVFGLKEF
jgi:hypothetical protein